MRAGHSATFGDIIKRLGASGVIVLAALLVLNGVYANFVDTRSAGTTPIVTGQVHIVLGTPAGDHGAVTVGPIHNMAENDTAARVVQLTNNVTVGRAGTTGLAAVRGLTLQTSASGPDAGSDIVTETTDGLHVTAQSVRSHRSRPVGRPGPGPIRAPPGSPMSSPT